MPLSTQLAAVAFALFVFGVVFEMVRRRLLRERYAILWLAAAFVLFLLASWTPLLRVLSNAIGIATPSNAFFVVAFAFLLLLVLHFSTVVSRLCDQTRVLAQRLALLEGQIQTRANVSADEPPAESASRNGLREEGEHERRVRAGTQS